MLLLVVGPTLGEELVCGQAGRKTKVPGGSGGTTGVRLDSVHINVHQWCLLTEPAAFQALCEVLGVRARAVDAVLVFAFRSFRGSGKAGDSKQAQEMTQSV